MSLHNRIIGHFTDSIQLKQDSLGELCELIEVASQRVVASLLSDGKILACGNGRSATCAQLLTSTLLNRLERDRPALPAIAFTNDGTTITGIANDYRYEEVFSKPIRALAQPSDVLVTYSDGNHSANIIKAIEVGHSKNLSIVALTCEKCEAVSALLNERDLEIRIMSNSAIRIYEMHVLITHCICDLVEHQLFDNPI